MHTHGEGSRDEASPKPALPRITESWRRIIGDNQRRRSIQAEQVVLFSPSTKDDAKERRADLFGQLEGVPIGSKRQRIGDETCDERNSRRSLREALMARANELKHEQRRRMDDHSIDPDSDKQKPKRIRLQGDDAITRLTNLGRQRQGPELGERVPRCDGRELS